MQGCWATRTTIKVTPWKRLLGTVDVSVSVWAPCDAACCSQLFQSCSFPGLLIFFFYCQIKSYMWGIETGWIHTIYHQSLGVRKALSFRNMEGNVWNGRIPSNMGNGTRQPRGWIPTQDHGLRPCFHCAPKSLGCKSSSCLWCFLPEPLICPSGHVTGLLRSFRLFRAFLSRPLALVLGFFLQKIISHTARLRWGYKIKEI